MALFYFVFGTDDETLQEFFENETTTTLEPITTSIPTTTNSIDEGDGDEGGEQEEEGDGDGDTEEEEEEEKEDSNKGCENTNNKLDEILKILRDKETPSTTQSE